MAAERVHSESRQRNELIGVRCTPAEKSRIKERAAAAGESAPEVLRRGLTLLESVARHYAAGNASLTGSQWRQHEQWLACPACEDGATASLAAERSELVLAGDPA